MHRLRRAAVTVTVIAAAVILSACGGGPGGPGGGWFSGGGSIFGGPTVNLAPIIGAPQKVSDELTQDLLAAAQERNLRLTTGDSTADYTVRGYLVASIERKGSKISYIWDVTDSKGQRVHRVAGDEIIATRSGSDPWSGVDSETLRRIAGKTTSELAAGMPRSGLRVLASSPAEPAQSPAATAPTSPAASAPAPRTAAAPAAEPKEVMALVTPVSGAPGDGRTSLTAALKNRLRAGGVKLATNSASNVYTVKGSVSMGQPQGGKQSIRIDWQVLDPNGRQLGTVSQQNNIPQGSLDGQWGPIADAAAGAAADGIIKLLPRPKS